MALRKAVGRWQSCRSDSGLDFNACARDCIAHDERLSDPHPKPCSIPGRFLETDLFSVPAISPIWRMPRGLQPARGHGFSRDSGLLLAKSCDASPVQFLSSPETGPNESRQSPSLGRSLQSLCRALQPRIFVKVKIDSQFNGSPDIAIPASQNILPGLPDSVDASGLTLTR